MGNGPVDFATMLQMQGAMETERGLARVWSAGSSEAVKQSYMQSAMQKGALAAENIRARFFKKEFEQILETRVKPLEDRLAAAKAARDQTMMTTTLPVSRTVTPEEYQMRADSLAQPVPGPAGPAKGGEGAKETQQPVPPPNAALDKHIGAVESQDALAIVDPASGQPVPLASPRGISVWNNAELSFWSEYSAVNQELMQVMSEYAGNPYADKYAESLVDSVAKQGNIATTGQADPTKAQEWMENRYAFETQQELNQQNIAANRLQLERAEPALNVDARDAERIAKTNPAFGDLVGKTIMKKFETGQPLTRNEKLEASSAVRVWRELQDKAIAKRARERIFRISPTNVTNPGNWQPEMRTADPVYKQYFGEEYANLVNDLQVQLLGMSPRDRVNTLKQFGASDDDIATFEEGGGVITPGLQNAIERLANSKKANVLANDLAIIRRLPELERQQPELAPIIDQKIEDAIQEIRNSNRVPDENLLRADRYRTFFEITYGREAPMLHDPETLANVDRVLAFEEAQDAKLAAVAGKDYEDIVVPPPQEAAAVVEDISTESPYRPFSWVNRPIFGSADEEMAKAEKSIPKSEKDKELKKKYGAFSWLHKPIAE